MAGAKGAPAAERLWIFDLDNTLHDATPHIFPHINRAMTDYIRRHLELDEGEANRIRHGYWRRYGATLLGLMRHHGIDPRHFLWHTHQFPDLPSMVVFDRPLRTLLARLPGRKVLFSNAPRHYADAVLALTGLRHAFDRVYAIEQVHFRPKPDCSGFLHILRQEKFLPAQAVMVEDSRENLATAKQLGMKTVLISRSSRRPPEADVVVPSVGRLLREARRL